MTLPKPLRMTADEFLAWAMEQEGRFELASGEVVAMAPERAAHARAKLAVARALGDAIRDGNLPCEAFTDGMAVRVDDATVHQPDASLRCGGPLDDDTVEFSDPVVLAEVLSPSTARPRRGRQARGLLPPAHGAALPDLANRHALGDPPRPRQGRGDHHHHRRRGETAPRPAGDRARS